MEISVDSLETPALTKAQLAEMLYQQIGLNKRESKDMIEAFFDLITQSLVEGNDVKISGFGNFQIRTKSARPGRNPRTGEVIPIAARRVVTFHASHKLKDLIQSEIPGQSGYIFKKLLIFTVFFALTYLSFLRAWGNLGSYIVRSWKPFYPLYLPNAISPLVKSASCAPSSPMSCVTGNKSSPS